ncbi:MAG: hypothetical protein IJR89_04765 [Clostridia bacterium]|nr:hypothetical protein [Clostridia bacterium]
MKYSTKTKVRAAVLVSFLLGVAAAALRYRLLTGHYTVYERNALNPQYTGHYEGGDGLRLAYALVLLLGAALLAGFALLIRRRLRGYAKTSGGNAYLMASLFLVFGIFFLAFDLLRDSFTSFSVLRTMLLVVSALSVGAIFYFCFQHGAERDGLNALLGIFPAFFPVLLAFAVYFDRSMAINDPQKSVFTLAAVFAGLFLSQEAHDYRERIGMSAYLFCGLGTILFGTAFCVPDLVYDAFHPETPVLLSLSLDIAVASFVVFAAIQLSFLHHARRGAVKQEASA